MIVLIDFDEKLMKITTNQWL